ncbi:hypothetical protein IGI04_035885 [Brassica rapa subsp. trilocularis]|uniref:Uncharacterized protein n=1 Tax=Brassica rapa subsp. trilocularis TaxID=1813537 RepID=A0ABQ7LFM8_BRACM|nr:hypothetical protein IGI04_035885 [Brassica rapa subsp. trilocularis]
MSFDLQARDLLVTPSHPNTFPKCRNVKLFRGIENDPLELIKYTERECHAWFVENAPNDILT